MNVLEILYNAYVAQHQDSKEVEQVIELFADKKSSKESDMILDLISDGLYQESKDGFIAGFKAAVSLFTAC